MISGQSVLHPETYPGIIADAFVTTERNLFQDISAEFPLSATDESIVSPAKDVMYDAPAELDFPTFGLSLAVLIESIWSAEKQQLILKVELDEGVAFVWQSVGKPIERGDKVLLSGAAEINLVSPRPEAHFIAATFQSILLLDEQAVLRADQLGLSTSIHFADSLKTVSTFMQRRQLAYRLMVIEKAFNQKFSIPRFISSDERSTIDFVYRAVVDRVFAAPFHQESFEFSANDCARELLAGMDGKQPFRFEIDGLQQVLLGQTLNLGQAKMRVQNATLVNPEEVERDLQKLDGHSFDVFIRSLSGLANYQFLDAPRLPDDAWDKLVEEMIELDEKLVNNLFKAVNELAAGSLADLTEEEKSEVTTRPQFD
jgi:hypothetical protein